MSTIVLVSNQGTEFSVERDKIIEMSSIVKDCVNDVEGEDVVPIPQLNDESIQTIIDYMKDSKTITEQCETDGERLMHLMNVATYTGSKEMLKNLCSIFASHINKKNVAESRKFFKVQPTLSLENEIAIRKKFDLWDSKEDDWDEFYKCPKGTLPLGTPSNRMDSSLSNRTDSNDPKYCTFEPVGELFVVDDHKHQKMQCTRCEKTYDEEWCCRDEYLKDPPPDSDEEEGEEEEGEEEEVNEVSEEVDEDEGDDEVSED